MQPPPCLTLCWRMTSSRLSLMSLWSVSSGWLRLPRDSRQLTFLSAAMSAQQHTKAGTKRRLPTACTASTKEDKPQSRAVLSDNQRRETSTRRRADLVGQGQVGAGRQRRGPAVLQQLLCQAAVSSLESPTYSLIRLGWEGEAGRWGSRGTGQSSPPSPRLPPKPRETATVAPRCQTPVAQRRSTHLGHAGDAGRVGRRRAELVLRGHGLHH